MKIEGNHIFQGPRQEVWDMFLDPNVLAQALPGTQKLDKVDDNTFEGVMNIRVGPVSGAFTGKVVRSNTVEPDSFTMTVDGKGAPGFLKGSGDVVLGDPGDGTTPMQYTGDVQVGGTLAGVGQRMLDSVSKSMIRAAFESLDKMLAACLAAKDSGGDMEFEAPTEAEFAKTVASDMASNILSGSKGRVILYVGMVLVVVVLLALIFTRRGRHLIVVTGAAGKTGQAILKALRARGVSDLGALVYRPEQVETLQASGVSRVVSGDMRDGAVLARVFEGAQAVYHICPNMSPDELEIGKTAAQAARAAGVARFVYHSVLHPQTRSMAHHWGKLNTEEMLFETGLPLTILQPGAYMQNLVANWENIASKGLYAVPYSAQARISMVDLNDVAEAAAIVLTQDGHTGAIYELAGPQALSQEEVAEICGRVLQRKVRFEEIPLTAWEQGQRDGGLGGFALDTLVSMFRYYDEHGLVGNSHVLEWLLGRTATTFEEFINTLAIPCSAPGPS